ncbi:putative lipase atg15 [Tulasnella sp. 419]|nr:putative lipase atg15 [Tulasnella sp. 418]KAG8968025.1 putative lipase atg15 [Tulasnella sp. 419]
MLPGILQHVFSLWSSLNVGSRLGFTPQPTTSALSFQLRHLHAVSDSTNIIFHDVSPQLISGSSYSLRLRPTKVHRPRSMEAFQQARIASIQDGKSQILDWEEDEVQGPDTEDRNTLLELAKMTSNAYVSQTDPLWYNLSDKWSNDSTPVGWEPDSDGFRGHIFTSMDNSTVVLSIKGTSIGALGGGGPTVKKDKLNDNLLFSCCCARVDWTWSTVCGCYSGGWKCDSECLDRSLKDDSLFYPVGTNLYNNITTMYPNANIWVIGHSLGGSLASLMGATFGVPVVAFEAPGERMAARRLHLPSPPELLHITHVYHTADVIAMGTCNGVLSSCAVAGYAMESKCHLGKSIVYDTVTKLNWTADFRTHRIQVVIDYVLSSDWEENQPVPRAVVEDNCVECGTWEYGKYANASLPVLPDPS